MDGSSIVKLDRLWLRCLRLIKEVDRKHFLGVTIVLGHIPLRSSAAPRELPPAPAFWLSLCCLATSALFPPLFDGGKGRAIVGLRVDSRLMMNRWVGGGGSRGARPSERARWSHTHTQQSQSPPPLPLSRLSYIISTIYPFDLSISRSQPLIHTTHLLATAIIHQDFVEVYIDRPTRHKESRFERHSFLICTTA